MSYTVQDATLQNDVIAELEWEPGVNAAHIGVSARDAAVTLTGHVATFDERSLARRAAFRVRGVRSVADEIEVVLSPEHRRDDEDIAEAIARALEWNAAIPDTVQARVSAGVASLSGTVETAYQRNTAESVVARLVGVKSVVNMIKVKAKVSDKNVRARITEAFHRQAQIDARGIKVETHEGTAVLSGHVRSLDEAEAAVHAAEAAPGIVYVENRLEVIP
jgi:osmotically-inducible protein OsmY